MENNNIINTATANPVTAIPCNSSSSGSCTCGLANHPGSNGGNAGKGGQSLPPPPPPPLNLCIVINICHYLTPLAKLIILAQPLESTSGEAERDAFLALQQILTVLDSGKNEPINVFPFFDKFCRYICTTFSDFEEMDIFLVWDYLVKLITLVIPPLREIFMGRLSLSLDEHAWHSLTTRCIHAQFIQSVQSLEDFIKTTLHQYDKDYYNDLDLYQYSQQQSSLNSFNNHHHNNNNNNNHSTSPANTNPSNSNASSHHPHRTSIESIKNFNSIILGRSPEILAFAIESGHLPSSLRFLDALSKTPSKLKSPATIKFPATFSLSALRDGQKNVHSSNSVNAASTAVKEAKDVMPAISEEELTSSNVYDLAAVVTLEGSNCDMAQAYYRYVHEENSHNQWFKGSGATHDLVDSSKAIERNYFNLSDSRKVHPRLLIYAKRGISVILDQLKDYVTKGGQLRSKGDATFATAETPEHYDEAKQYYEEAIAHDASLRTVLQERLNSLEQIEKNQKAQSYENQADLSLGKRRFKEACDLYKLAMRSAVVNSPTYNRIREKEDYMMRIISLEIANHLTEKGEECLKSGSYTQSRENFAQALKLNPNYIHLQSIIQGIDKLITQQTSAQKVSEANQAMKIGRYKYANQLFQEAVALVPEREATLKPVLDSLVVLMQGEDALMKQRSGLIALEDKKYPQAISLISEAITLLPPESITEHAFFLCDRAQVYFEMKEYLTSISDCHAALELRPELAIAYLRLGSAQFELEHYDEALGSYEKVIRNDPSLADQVKTKIRQVNTAKEVQQRKERETERARIREEEMKRLEEKRAREEKVKKEKLEKQREEQAEKGERSLMKEEEKRIRLIENRPEIVSSSMAVVGKENEHKGGKHSKESLKEKQKREKAEKEAIKQHEKERLRLEKEKERERLKVEKELKLREELQAKEEEMRRHREFSAEIEKAEAKLKEAEREKEIEREKARVERERLLAEREKAKQERKTQQDAIKKTKASISTKEQVVDSPFSTVKQSFVGINSNVDPDFPTLGSSVNAVPPQTKKTLESTNAHSKQKTGANAPPVASTKWSALLTSNSEGEPVVAHEDQNKRRINSLASNAISGGNALKHKAAMPSSDYIEHFPTLSGTEFAESNDRLSGTTPYADPAASGSSNSTMNSESVLSSGELKALISKTINDIPSIQLPQSMRLTSFEYAPGATSFGTATNAHQQLYQTSAGSKQSISQYSEDPHKNFLNTAPLQSLTDKPPGISPAFSGNSNGVGSGYSSTLVNTQQLFLNNPGMIASPTRLSVNPMIHTPEAIDTPNLLPNSANSSGTSLSRAQSNSYESLYLTHPPGVSSMQKQIAGAEIDRSFNFASLPSLEEPMLSFDGFSSAAAGVPSFSNGSAPLGAPSIEESGSLNMRTSSRLTSLFGKSNELGVSSDHSSYAGGSSVGGYNVRGFGGPAISGAIGESVPTGGKDVLGYSFDSYSLNYSFDNHVGTLTPSAHSLSAVPQVPQSTMVGDFGVLGLSGTLDSSESLFGSLHSSTNKEESSSRFTKLFSGLNSSLEGHNDVAGGNPNITLSGASSIFGGLDSNNIGNSSFSFLSPTEATQQSLLGNSASLGGFWSVENASVASANPMSTVFGNSSLPPIISHPTINVKKYELYDLGKRLEDEVIRDYSTFSNLAPLHRFYSVSLFHWATDGKDWVEYALFVPHNVLAILNHQSGLRALAHSSRCELAVKEVMLSSQKETVFILSCPNSSSSSSITAALNVFLDGINKRIQQHATTLATVSTLASATSSPALPNVASPSTTASNSVQSAVVALSADGRWSESAQGKLPLGETGISNAGISMNAGEFTIADSVIDSLISPSVMTEKDLLSSPSSVSSSGAGNANSLSSSILPPAAPHTIATTNVGTTNYSSSVVSSPSITKKGLTAATVVAKGGASSLPAPSLARPTSNSKAASSPSTPSATIATPSLTITSSNLPAGQIRRFLEIPSELIGLVIGHQGRKIKELAAESGSKIQFRTSKTSEKEGKPGVLEIHGTVESVDKAVAMVAELLHSVGKEFREVNAQQAKAIQR